MCNIYLVLLFHFHLFWKVPCFCLQTHTKKTEQNNINQNQVRKIKGRQESGHKWRHRWSQNTSIHMKFYMQGVVMIYVHSWNPLSLTKSCIRKANYAWRYSLMSAHSEKGSPCLPLASTLTSWILISFWGLQLFNANRVLCVVNLQILKKDAGLQEVGESQNR